ncbi:hypothetical protein LIER_11766 [Lithospermum erythrorhizon]|uniref:Uncharacterized protein n=1 Tax=Lithospermum erythrorhizon TaxID=34254 RepID=A0AAV3PTL2_LITER
MMLRKYRGLRLGRKLVKVFKRWVNFRLHSRATYKRLRCSSPASNAISKICKWGTSLKNGAMVERISNYVRVRSEPMVERISSQVPRGYLVVYVEDEEDDTSRVLVPVIYFNHPLFVNLLREAEMVFGFNHERGVQIPCQKADLEIVKKRIAATVGGGFCRGRWSCMKV